MYIASLDYFTKEGWFLDHRPLLVPGTQSGPLLEFLKENAPKVPYATHILARTENAEPVLLTIGGVK